MKMARDYSVNVLVQLVVLMCSVRRSLEIVDSNVIQVWAAPGGSTRLPCNVGAPMKDLEMMLWFKGKDRMPIYTVDFRNGAPIHWAVAGEFGDRATFVLNETDPSSAHLAVGRLLKTDEGLYRCRIDYVDSPTKNYKVNLTIVVPPEPPRIYDSDGAEIVGSNAGPFREGQDVLLHCKAPGGRPPPNIAWYKGDKSLARVREGVVVQLHLRELSREWNGVHLQCRVDPPLLKPIVREVTLKMFLKPQFVKITGKAATRAGSERSFVCTTRGSKPAPNIDWFINSQKVDSINTEVTVEGEVTRSVLTWRMRREDSGRTLVCRVSNPWFPAHTLEDALMLEVLCKVDFRNGAPIHWAVAGEFGDRATFVLNETDPSSAHLAVGRLLKTDEGLYRCRIDYVDSPTKNYKVNLTIVVPPEPPRIYDSDGAEIVGSNAGPFREGQDVLLHCKAPGGRPPPNIAWYKGDKSLARVREGVVVQLHLRELSREWNGVHLQCRVDPPLLKPIVREVTLKMFLKPQFVKITGKAATRAGSERSFVCTTRGSKPAPNIDWFINSQKVDSINTEVTVEGEVTRSVLTWRMRREDSGRTLVCRVSNPWFPAHTLEDALMLEVLYPPVAQISLTEPKELKQIREDENAELLCSANAMPPPSNYSFYKDDHLIFDDPIGGIAVENNKLIIRGLRRYHSARYRCRATNSEGSVLSESFTLNVLSRPECSAGGVVQQLAGNPGGLVRARCSVTAPSTIDAGPLRFFWTYNGTKDVLPIPASNMTVSGSTSSVVHGLPLTEDADLGWLACWASNDVGNQRDPCLFRIMPAALPEPPTNCELFQEDMSLRCEPGHDGGLPQRFLLEVLEVGRQSENLMVENEISTLNDQGIAGRGLSETVYRVSNDAPQFSLDTLSPGRYTFLIYSETPRGRSPRPAALHSVPIRTSDDLDRPGSLQTMTPPPPPPTVTDNSVALLVGAVLSLVLVTILTTLCVSLVVMCKKKGRSRPDPEQSTILRRNVGVSMYGGSSLGPSVMPTVVVRGHRGSRVLAARWSGVLDDTPLAVLALDSRPEDFHSSYGDLELQPSLATHVEHMETQTDS